MQSQPSYRLQDTTRVILPELCKKAEFGGCHCHALCSSCHYLQAIVSPLCMEVVRQASPSLEPGLPQTEGMTVEEGMYRRLFHLGGGKRSQAPVSDIVPEMLMKPLILVHPHQDEGNSIIPNLGFLSAHCSNKPQFPSLLLLLCFLINFTEVLPHTYKIYAPFKYIVR